MTQNRSIDGLKVRPVKKVQTTDNDIIFNSRTSVKPAKKPQPQKITIKEEPVNDILPDELLDAFDDEKTDALPDELLNAFDETEDETEEKAPEETEEDSKKPAEKSDDKSKKPKKKSKMKKVILSIFLVLLLAAIGAGIYFLVWGNDLVQKLTGGNSTIWDAISTLVSDDYVELKTDNNGRVNILIIGTSGFDMSGDNGGGGSHDGADLTDTIMVVSVNPKTGDIAMLSVPRDLKALKPCTGTGKINETYWCNIARGASEADANRALESELSSMLGISFQYYAHVNWGSVVTIVDTLGGITVTLDDDVNDVREDNKILIKAGEPTNLIGIEALRLARARYGVADGDFSRTEHQQKIIMAIKDKIVSSKLSITDLLNLASALGDNLRTDVTIEEMKSAAHTLLGFDFTTARQIPLTVHDYLRYTPCNNGASCIGPRAGDNNYTAIRSYVKDELLTDPLKRENAKILVANATGKDGIAATVRSKIEGNTGLAVTDITNAPASDYPAAYTIYYLSGRTPLSLQTLQQLFKNNIIVGSESLPEGLSDNYDLIVVVTSDALPASSL